jgi:hypothetical protein
MHAFSAFEQQQQRDRAVQEIDRLEEIDRVVHAPPVVNQLLAMQVTRAPGLSWRVLGTTVPPGKRVMGTCWESEFRITYSCSNSC